MSNPFFDIKPSTYVWGRIKPGTRIYQDFYLSRWPRTVGSVHGKETVDPNMRFKMYLNDHGRVTCVAKGYGDFSIRDGYGNGAIEILSEPKVKNYET